MKLLVCGTTQSVGQEIFVLPVNSPLIAKSSTLEESTIFKFEVYCLEKASKCHLWLCQFQGLYFDNNYFVTGTAPVSLLQQCTNILSQVFLICYLRSRINC